jgi:hypothetical protein
VTLHLRLEPYLCTRFIHESTNCIAHWSRLDNWIWDKGVQKLSSEVGSHLGGGLLVVATVCPCANSSTGVSQSAAVSSLPRHGCWTMGLALLCGGRRATLHLGLLTGGRPVLLGLSSAQPHVISALSQVLVSHLAALLVICQEHTHGFPPLHSLQRTRNIRASTVVLSPSKYSSLRPSCPPADVW